MSFWNRWKRVIIFLVLMILIPVIFIFIFDSNNEVTPEQVEVIGSARTIIETAEEGDFIVSDDHACFVTLGYDPRDRCVWIQCPNEMEGYCRGAEVVSGYGRKDVKLLTPTDSVCVDGTWACTALFYLKNIH